MFQKIGRRIARDNWCIIIEKKNIYIKSLADQ